MPEYELHSYQWWGRFFETAAVKLQATIYKEQFGKIGMKWKIPLFSKCFLNLIVND